MKNVRLGRAASVLVFTLLLFFTPKAVVVAQAAGITLVQSGSTSGDSSGSTLTKAFTSANTAGNLIVAAISFDSTNGTTWSCTDSLRNTYTVAVSGNDSRHGQLLAICYAANIKAGANTVTLNFGTSSHTFRRLTVHEYSGIAASTPLDVTASNIATGSSATNAVTSNAAVTTQSGDLIFGAVFDDSGTTTITAGTGFSSRQSIASDMLSEDLLQAAAGSIAAKFTFRNGSDYLAQLAAFKPASVAQGDTTPPTASITSPAGGATVSGSINVTANASDNVAVASVKFQVDGLNIGTPDTTAPYSATLDTTALSNGNHVLTATVTDTSSNSTTSAAVTVVVSNVTDTTPPSVPTGLASSNVSANSATISWNASTDNVGVTGYNVYRNTAQIGSTSGPSYVDGTVAASTAYTYTVSAFDAAGNTSARSNGLSVTTGASSAGPAYPVKTSANSRYLVDQNNVPFMIVGDSPHSMIVNLSLADAETYMANRASYGINTLWTEILCTPYISNCNSSLSTYDGIAPFNNGDLAAPNPNYFARVDGMISIAASHGIQILLDTWETGDGMPMLRSAGNTKAFNYGVYLGNRYRNVPNITWITGNDFQSWMTTSDNTLIKNIMAGIASVDPNHLQTTQLNYFVSGTHDDTLLLPYTTLGEVYSYYPQYAKIYTEYNATPTLPVFMEEANYEGENNTGNDPSTTKVLRQQEYWSMLAGATAGQMYGNGATVSFANGWQSQLNTPGVRQLQFMKNFFTSKAWYTLIPDQNHSVVTAGFGTFADSGDVHSNTYLTAAESADQSRVIIYMPTIRTITVNMTKLAASGVTAQWFDPSNNTFTTVAGSPFPNTGTRQFAPTGNNADGNDDWVLVLEAPLTPDVTPPSVPTGLTATTVSASAINLSWTASTDDRGVSGYNVYRNNAMVATIAATTYSDTGLAAGSNYSYAVAAFDAAGNTSGQSTSVAGSTSTPDATPPTAPANLAASNLTATSVTISWTASTDNVGVAGYTVFRGGAQIGTTTQLSYDDSGLTPSSQYSYTVAAFDGSNNASAPSAPLVVNTPVQQQQQTPAFVQLHEASTVVNSNSVASGGFASPVTSGHLLVVWLWYNSGTQSVTSVADTNGNVYARAVGPTTGTGSLVSWRQELWYAKNVTGGTGLSVTATFNGTFNAKKAISVHEYSGMNTTAPLDVTAAAATSTSNASSGAVTTTAARELVFGAALFFDAGASGTGFVQRSSISSNVSEDKVVTTVGSYSVVFNNSSQSAIVQMATFKAGP